MSAPFKAGWFVVELMGHRRYVGHVTEVRIGGAEFLRLESPGDPEPIEVIFGAPSVYAMTRTTEERAREEHQREEDRERSYLLSSPPRREFQGTPGSEEDLIRAEQEPDDDDDDIEFDK